MMNFLDQIEWDTLIIKECMIFTFMKQLTVALNFSIKLFSSKKSLTIRDDTHMASMKIVQFLRPSTHFVHLRPQFFHSFDLERPISRTPSPLQMITNQLKENIIQGWLFMLSGTPFMSAFVFSINSLILPGFPLISFHLVEASLFAFFVALHSCVCCCPRNVFYL